VYRQGGRVLFAAIFFADKYGFQESEEGVAYGSERHDVNSLVQR
jgi:hypothetical protein